MSKKVGAGGRFDIFLDSDIVKKFTVDESLSEANATSKFRRRHHCYNTQLGGHSGILAVGVGLCWTMYLVS